MPVLMTVHEPPSTNFPKPGENCVGEGCRVGVAVGAVTALIEAVAVAKGNMVEFGPGIDG